MSLIALSRSIGGFLSWAGLLRVAPPLLVIATLAAIVVNHPRRHRKNRRNQNGNSDSEKRS
jgi:hypothetical protein